MSKLNIYNLPIRAHGISPKGNYERKFSSLTREFAELDTEQGCTPLGIDVVTLLPGKKDWPYHLHATQ